MASDARQQIALMDLLATIPPGHRPQPWSWEDEELDIRSRLCLCCGEPGHYQETIEAVIAERGLTDGVCIGADGRLHDGHHRVIAALHLGIDRIPLEPKESADARWQRDHGGTMWELRRFGDVHAGEAWAYVQNVRQQAREFVAWERSQEVSLAEERAETAAARLSGLQEALAAVTEPLRPFADVSNWQHNYDGAGLVYTGPGSNAISGVLEVTKPPMLALRRAALALNADGEAAPDADHAFDPVQTIEGVCCRYCKGPESSPRHYAAHDQEAPAARGSTPWSASGLANKPSSAADDVTARAALATGTGEAEEGDYDAELSAEDEAAHHATVKDIAQAHGFPLPDWKPTLPAAPADTPKDTAR